jgi:hypothetical protein
MKSIIILLGAGLVSFLAGCATTPIALAPVGPDPHGLQTTASDGNLEVYSGLVACFEGNNPPWHQHSDYRIYDLQGRLVKYVGNAPGHYDQAPLLVSLPPGEYRLHARASDYLRVDVPVIIERGRTTKVHLDDRWRLPAYASNNELVSLPNGNPVGWPAGTMETTAPGSGAAR